MAGTKDLPIIPVKTEISQPLEVNANISASGQIKTPLIIRIPIPTANLEQSYAIPTLTKRYTIIAGIGSLTIAFETIGATNFIPLPAGATIEEKDIDPTANLTLYFKSSQAPDTLTLWIWS